jgi:L-alanine-DL-glutamate epimerase-like enolase superfamily enzyme
MIINTVIEEFSIPLSPPLVVSTGGATRIFDMRNGAYFVVVHLGTRFVGEMVEPVFSVSESPDVLLEQNLHALRKAERKLNQSQFDASNWVKELERILEDIGCAESTRLAAFAVEQAFVRLVANLNSLPLYHVIYEWVFREGHSNSAVKLVKLNTMFNSRMGESVAAASGCVKVKVGSTDPRADAALVNQVVHAQRKSGRWLRLDANQMWTVDQAVEFANGLTADAVNAIEYVEEPVIAGSIVELSASLEYLRKLSENWNLLTVALDESLLRTGVEDLLTKDKALRVIHKTFLHGLYFNRSIITTMADRVTITCTFETGHGLSFLCSIAAAVNPDAFHGIHALHSLINEDHVTKNFLACTQSAANGSWIKLDDLEHLDDTK